MASVMEMPKLSDTMKEGAIARWLKKEGEKVQVGLPIVEIETDKATMEYEAPSGGVLLKILIGDNQNCGLGDPIAVIGKEGENWQEALDKHKDKKGSSPAAKGAAPKGASPKAATTASAQPSKSSDSQAQKSAPETSDSQTNDRLKASPLAKKVAADKGINLGSIQGSGPNGRIVIRDLENVSASSSSSSRSVSGVDTEKIPLSMMRKTIARRLTESVTQAPHFYLTVSANLGPALKWRKNVMEVVGEENKFSVNDLMIYFVAQALRKHPVVNSSWQEDHILQHNRIHMGVAVALPTGLITPVVRNADSLSVIQIAKKSRDLIKLARDGKLQPDDYSGGTFTISNLGMQGVEEFTAIINPPQAAILAVGATIPTPVVGPRGDVIVENKIKLTLSCDHRVIDGASGAEFLKTLKSIIEEPLNLMLI